MNAPNDLRPTLRNRLGTSLVEILVVMGIMLLLASILLPAGMKLYKAARALKQGN